MALTMTRTRTQTALTKLAEMVANVNGELEFVEAALVQMPKHKEVLAARHRRLLDQRNALYVTLRQFDANLQPEAIGSLGGWMKPFGRKPTRATMLRYLTARV